mmetsp:Transcript_26098/g.71912  ORF Transcript_26098/g.71912 Transcript_26098/m.71912 type:complete len:103 (-) Transcript_26098:950-1258(-)
MQAYLHSLSPPIIHRDLKSQNLLITHDWSVKVADFGLAREYQRQTATMSRVGSVQWAAPEVLLGGDYSHKCDIWCDAQPRCIVPWLCTQHGERFAFRWPSSP